MQKRRHSEERSDEESLFLLGKKTRRIPLTRKQLFSAARLTVPKAPQEITALAAEVLFCWLFPYAHDRPSGEKLIDAGPA
jgi:hypothetical protein